MQGLTPEALERVAAYFQALSEPTRLQLLNLLRTGERNVGELAELTGYTSANVSRHLAFLTRHGLLARESRGPAAYYRIADPKVFELCDIVCGNIARHHERALQDGRLFAATAKAAARKATGSRRRQAR